MAPTSMRVATLGLNRNTGPEIGGFGWSYSPRPPRGVWTPLSTPTKSPNPGRLVWDFPPTQTLTRNVRTSRTQTGNVRRCTKPQAKMCHSATPRPLGIPRPPTPHEAWPLTLACTKRHFLGGGFKLFCCEVCLHMSSDSCLYP